MQHSTCLLYTSVLRGQHHFVGLCAGDDEGDVHVKAQHCFEGLFEQAEITVRHDLSRTF